MTLAIATAAAAIAPAVGVAKSLPADFGWLPSAPAAGQPTTLTATSDAAGVIAVLWDLDADNVFDAIGTSVTTTFAAPGPHPVALDVISAEGDSGAAMHTVPVGPPAPAAPPPLPPPAPIAAPPPGPMVPFPVVRIQGTLVPGGARITRFTVHAPAGALVHVACVVRGHGCPRAASDTVSQSAARGVRVRKFERRYRAGAIVQAIVSSTTSIGKYTSFRIRTGRAPFRRDLCVAPGGLSPIRCPGG